MTRSLSAARCEWAKWLSVRCWAALRRRSLAICLSLASRAWLRLSFIGIDIAISSAPRNSRRRYGPIDLALDPVRQRIGCRRRRRLALTRVNCREHAIIGHRRAEAQAEYRSALVDVRACERRRSQRRRI